MQVMVSVVPRWLRGAAVLRLAVVLCAVAATFLVMSPRAGAQGTGFTGEIYYGGGVYPPRSPFDGPIENHSYGFNSATNISQTARGPVFSGIGRVSDGVLLAWASANDLARVCVQGTYPNCVDTDGWTGYVEIANDSFTTSLRIQGHGVY